MLDCQRSVQPVECEAQPIRKQGVRQGNAAQVSANLTKIQQRIETEISQTKRVSEWENKLTSMAL